MPSFLFLLLTLTLCNTSYSQIYADFTVRQSDTSLGTFRVRLDYDRAPRACANFIGLATGERAWINPTNGTVEIGKKYYDGIIFHRLIHNFVIQGGDPLGTGTGGPGYVFQDQFDPTLRHDSRYILSMAHAGTNTNGSQFFITLEPAANLDDEHTVFGEVINDSTHPNGRAIIDSFTDATTFPTNSPGDRPITEIKIDSVVISRVGAEALAFDINSPSLRLPTVRGITPQPIYETTLSDPIFSLNWPIAEKKDYIIRRSTDLTNWSIEQNILSLLPPQDFSFQIPDISTTPSLFSRVAEIDYSTFENAPSSLLTNNSQLIVSLAGSNITITLTFDGSTGGTWTDNTGASGTLSNTFWTDNVPSAGSFNSPGRIINLLPLGTFQTQFNPPTSAGIAIINLPMDFQTSTTGYVDGTITLSNSSQFLFRGPFVYTPGP